MLDYAEVLIADPNTRTITITSEDGSRTAEVRATVSLGVDIDALENTAIQSRDLVRLERATAAEAQVQAGDLVQIPGEPDYVVQTRLDQPRTGSTLFELELADVGG